MVIPHWNGYEVLKECLESLEATTYPALEVIIVDNASHDGSPELIEKEFPHFKLIRNSNNAGYAGGCNRGAESAAGDYLLFLNNDTVHEPQWISNLVETLEKDNNSAAVQPKILNYFSREKFDYAGGCGGHLDILGFPLAEGRLFNEIEHDHGQYEDSDRIFWSSGTAFLIRKAVFFKVGKFDESFFAHMEEVDLCWRLHLAGYDVRSNPKAVIYHRNAATLPMYSHLKYYLNHRNSLLMLLTNYSLVTALYLYPLRFALEGVACVYALSKLDFAHITAIVRAQLWLLVHPGLIWRKRRFNKHLRELKDRKIMKKMVRKSAVFEHYILRKKTWAEIKHP